LGANAAIPVGPNGDKDHLIFFVTNQEQLVYFSFGNSFLIHRSIHQEELVRSFQLFDL